MTDDTTDVSVQLVVEHSEPRDNRFLNPGPRLNLSEFQEDTVKHGTWSTFSEQRQD